MPICGAGLVACLGDGFEHHFERFFIGFQIRSESAFIAHRGGIAALLQHALQRVKYFDAHAQRFGELARAVGDDHELLRIHRIVGVRAAVEDVHQWNRQQIGADATQVSIERRDLRMRGSARGGHGHGQDRVRAQLGFVRRAVQLDHRAIDGALVFRLHAGNGRRDLLDDIGDGLAGTLAQIALGIVVAQLDGFVLTGGSAGRNGGAADGTIREMYVSFDRGIASRVENLTAQ